MKIVKECENIIKTNKKKIISFAYEQGKIFEKFKEDTKFKNLVNKNKQKNKQKYNNI